MPLADIQLDDRTFEQLDAELRRRIPAFTPDWTDHNDSDPGVALLQLFAWLQEMTVWRLNQVPKKNYVKFLQFVGEDLTPATPAVAELKFTLTSKDLGVGIPVPAGTRVRMASAADGKPVIFETDDDITVMGGEIAQVQVFDGGAYSAVTEEQRAAGQHFAPFSNQPIAGAALLLGFDRPLPTSITHRLTVHVVRPDGKVILPVAATPADRSPPASIVWEYMSGDPVQWTALTIVTDTTLAFTQSGITDLILDKAAPTQQATLIGAFQRPSDPKLYWIRARIDFVFGPGFQSHPLIEDVQTNTAIATNAVTHTNELLGLTNGLPDQTFMLSGIPVLAGGTNPDNFIAIDEGNGYVPWTRVDDFGASGPNDTHYTLDLAKGLVTFGNGINGKIPRYVTDAAGSADSSEANVMAIAYRAGGGAAGNAGPDVITTLDDVIPFVQGVTNPRPSAGGADEETIDEAGARIPKALRTQYRAVTAADFADIAMLTPGVQISRAYALSQFHPVLSVARAPLQPGANATEGFVPFPGVVTVFVIPMVTQDVRQPMPTEDFCKLVAARLDKSRLITTEVYVTGPNYRKVEVEVTVIAKPQIALRTVHDVVNKKLLAFFHPVTGGEEGTGWDFGGVVSLTEALGQILTTEGVARVKPDTFKLYVDGVSVILDVPLGASEIVYSGDHRVKEEYA